MKVKQGLHVIRVVLLALVVSRLVGWKNMMADRMVAWTQITSPQGSKKGPMSEMVQKNWHGFEGGTGKEMYILTLKLDKTIF